MKQKLQDYKYQAKKSVDKSETSLKKYAQKTPGHKKRQMFDHLSAKLHTDSPVPVEKKCPETVSKPPQNIAEMDFLDECNIDDDQDLLAFMEKIERENKDLCPVPDENALQSAKVETQGRNELKMQWNAFNTIRNMPAMFFPNSNVTINYNFNSQ